MKMLNRDNTNKRNIVNNIFNATGIPLSYATKLIDDLLNIIIFSVHTKKILKVKNFGSFSLKEKGKRSGRNPLRTQSRKTVVRLPISKVIQFNSIILSLRDVAISNMLCPSALTPKICFIWLAAIIMPEAVTNPVITG